MKKPEEDTSVIKEKAIIYSKPKNEYEERVNEAAISLALKDPNLILGRGKLFCVYVVFMSLLFWGVGVKLFSFLQTVWLASTLCFS